MMVYTSFTLGLLIGLVIGGCVVVVTMAMMIAGSKADDQLLGEEQYK